MGTITLETFQGNVREICNRVLDDQEPVEVALDEDRKVVVLDLEDYRGILDTLHLLGNPENAERLRESVRQMKAGKTREIDVAAYLD